MTNFKGHIYGLIAEIEAAERITKAKLSILSRDIMHYVLDTCDIDAVNRLVSVLTPRNRTAAIFFFTHFIPHQRENDEEGNFVRFGKKLQNEDRYQDKAALIAEFLAIEDQDIWTWSRDNIEEQVKPKDFSGPITRAITNALKGDDKTGSDPLSRESIMLAVYAGGITLEDMFDMVTKLEEQMVKEEEAAKQQLAEAEALAAAVEEQVAA